MRALDAYPEIEDRLSESAAERALRAKQRPLDLELTMQRQKAEAA
jgi:hypothetical protein